MYLYTVDMGNEKIDLDLILSILKNECVKDAGYPMKHEMIHFFGEPGYRFIVETVQDRINKIKEEQGGEEVPEEDDNNASGVIINEMNTMNEF